MEYIKSSHDISKSNQKNTSHSQKKQGKYELKNQYLQNTRYMNKLIQSLPLTCSGVLTLRYLVECYQDYGVINPSIEDISKVVKFKSKHSTTKKLAFLAEEGFLQIESNFQRVQGRTTYRQTTNTYRITNLLEKFYDLSLVQEELNALEKKIRCTRGKRNKEALELKKNKVLENLAEADHACDLRKKEIKAAQVKGPSLLEFEANRVENASEEDSKNLRAQDQSYKATSEGSSPIETFEKKVSENENLEPTSQTQDQSSCSSRMAPYTTIDYANIPLSPEGTLKEFKKAALEKEKEKRQEALKNEPISGKNINEDAERVKKRKPNFLSLGAQESPAVRKELQARMLHDAQRGVDMNAVVKQIDTREKLLLYYSKGADAFLS